MKASLTLKGGTKVEVADGEVDMSGTSVVLSEFNRDKICSDLVLGYCLIPGEIVRRVGKGEYIVEF